MEEEEEGEEEPYNGYNSGSYGYQKRSRMKMGVREDTRFGRNPSKSSLCGKLLITVITVIILVIVTTTITITRIQSKEMCMATTSIVNGDDLGMWVLLGAESSRCSTMQATVRLWVWTQHI